MDGNILFVDDSETNQHFYEAVLNRYFPDLGFLAASNFPEAIELFSGHLAETPVVVTEVAVGGGGGISLLSRMLEMKPELCCIVVSAYLPTYPETPTLMPKGEFSEARAVIRKPFEVSLLVREIGEALAAGA